MDENLHNIDDLFKKAIDRHEEMPSANVWANIDKNLDKKKVIAISEKYRKLKWVAAALLIFSAGMAMYTVHTRIKNRELARMNMSRKNAGKKGIGNKTAAPVQPQSNTSTYSMTDSIAKDGRDDALVDKEERQAEKQETASTDMVKLKREIKERVFKDDEPKPGAIKSETQVEPGEDANEVVLNEKPVDLALVSDKARPFLGLQSADTSLANVLTKGSKFQNSILANEKTAVSDKVKGVRKSFLSAIVFYSKDFVSAKLSNGYPRYREDARNEIKNKEQIKNTSSFGVLADYNIGGIAFESGLSFSSMKTYIQPKFIFARADERGNVNYRFTFSAGYSYVPLRRSVAPTPGDSVNAISSTTTLEYVSVPLAVKFTFGKGKFRVRPSAGIAANFLTKGKIETEIAVRGGGSEKASINKIEGLSKSYMSGLVSIGAEYNLGKKTALTFTPVSRFALSAINKDAPVKTYLNSFGLMSGVMIRL